MRIVALGDLHGRSIWRKILEQEKNADQIIMVGDYLDTRDGYTVGEQLHNLKEIIHLTKDDERIKRLIGNHDYHYFPWIGYTGTSGYQGSVAALQFGKVLEEYKDYFKMAHLVKDGDHKPLLFSHAGIGMSWLEANQWDPQDDIHEHVNDVWKHKPFAFRFNGREPSGDDVYQTPIWIRPNSLILDTKHNIAKEYIQVVGHTSKKSINLDSANAGYAFIDTLEVGEYLIINDGVFSIGKVK